MIKIDDVQIVINSVYERGLRQELLDKVFFLLSCIKGTIPMNRNIGLDPNIISQLDTIARNLYTVSVIELIEEFEDRLSVEEVQFESGDSGNMIPKVVLSYNGE